MSDSVYSILRSYISACEDLSTINPFEIHVLVLNAAMANWRPYLIHLTTETGQQVVAAKQSHTSNFTDTI
jgi:hypothetical protein